MGNFSKLPSAVLQANLSKNYVGVYIEQGVPVLDRDLNLLQDLISRTLRTVVSRFIGDGVTAASTAFAIQSITINNNFRILGGTAMVNGLEVINGGDLNYLDQAGVPPLTAPLGFRTDTVYLDVSLAEVTGAQDAELLNSGDVGLQTSVRQKVVWVVRVVEGLQSPPAPAAGHTHFLLARLARSPSNQIQPMMIIDIRRQIMSLAETIRLLFVPGFTTTNQFSPVFGGPGGNITIFGRNFNVGQLTATFSNNTTSATASVFNISATTATVTVPPGFPSGDARITIANQFGSETCPSTFNVL